MEQAGVYNFLRTIFYIVIIYYAFKFVMRIIVPFISVWLLAKMEQSANDYKRKSEAKENNEITGKKSKKSDSEKVGEYIDFEEIE